MRRIYIFFLFFAAACTDPVDPPCDPAALRSIAHDIYIRDGLAFLSHWNAGMIIIDVGNGIRGGSPTNPLEISRLSTGLNSVHNIWYWPTRKLAFIGEERASGRLQIIDLADLTQPRLIGYREITGSTTRAAHTQHLGATAPSRCDLCGRHP